MQNKHWKPGLLIILIGTFACHHSSGFSNGGRKVPIRHGNLVANRSLRAVRTKVPLMPPREEDRFSFRLLAQNDAPSVPSPFSIGAELGIISRATNIHGGDFGGLNLLFGGRVLGRWLPTKQWLFSPNLGYFRRYEGTKEVGVTENVFDIGVGSFWMATPESGFLGLGLVQRLEFLVSSISAFESSQTSSPAIRYRAGPAVTLEIPLAVRWSLVADLEAPMSFESRPKVLPAIGVGVIFLP
ncbi:MAG: hypothetical protein HY537_08275 [Deltaproteobacteria bacterium]|nr:hypothetical protein [Deltaproteobacteria bacterium]